MICELAIDPHKVIVARGYADECQLLHGRPLREDCSRVSIMLSLDNSTPLSFPLEDMSIVGEAVGSYVPWPRRLIILHSQVQQQQLSHLSQVFGGRLHEPKENYTGSGTWINFLHSLISSNMPSLSPRITSIHVFFGLPCALLTCPKLIRSTRRTSASVSLRRT